MVEFQLTRKPAPMVEINTAAMIGKFFEFKERLDEMEVEANAVAVYDAATLARAEEMIAQAQKLDNAMAKRRAEVTRPLLDSKKSIDGAVGKLRDQIGRIRRIIDGESVRYIKQIEAERLKKEAQAREAMRKAAREAEEKEEAARIQAAKAAEKEAQELNYSERDRHAAVSDAVSAVVPVAPEIPEIVVDDRTKIKTESGSMTLDYEYVGELEDIRIVPVDILRARWKQIQAAIQPEINHRVKSGVRTIPGVKISRKQVIKRRVR